MEEPDTSNQPDMKGQENDIPSIKEPDTNNHPSLYNNIREGQEKIRNRINSGMVLPWQRRINLDRISFIIGPIALLMENIMSFRNQDHSPSTRTRSTK